MTGQTFAVGPRPNGTIEMVVTGSWSDQAGAAFVEEGADTLVLNYALGFDMADLRFLDGLPVRNLVVIDRRLQSLDPIYGLAPTLRNISLTVDPALTVDLERLPELTEIQADWGQIRQTFRSAVHLARLFAGRYTEDDLWALAPAGDLETLVLKDRPRLKSLDGLAALPGLRHLGVHLAARLSDTGAVRGSMLRELHLEACKKVTTLDDIATCGDLEVLDLSDGASFSSAEPLRALTKLRELLLSGSTRISDGDLRPIADLPQLRELRMQSRRNYRPSVEEVQKIISERQ
ncbi:hypothetical protein GCM10009630_41180 [Kribbella jejuensis]|uniref:Leucine rich repeat (LRR) protein n=1 Tax=Kribbella jejuensis TaxID=236068 RepID=A0A542E930_9ACTN|nr:leucine-rich repeat domain-containing protein [Kribbella jejuensis]TQJ11835.1 hypothetical protein FB475_4758 [Kribbella jejuensis]